MSDISRIGLYHNLFLGCLVIFLVCAAIAVVLFFVLDMKKVIGYLTGRTAKRQIEKLEEDNASSGRLRKKNHSSIQKVDKKMQQETTLLNNGEQETSLLERGNTEQMDAAFMEQILEDSNATSLLRDEKIEKRTFRIEREIMLIHTEEVI